jgi:cytochrome b
MTAQRILHTSHHVAGVLVVYAVVVALVVQKNGE